MGESGPGVVRVSAGRASHRTLSVCSPMSENRKLVYHGSFSSSAAPAHLSFLLSSSSEGGWTPRQGKSSSQSFLASVHPLQSPRNGSNKPSLIRIHPLVLSYCNHATTLSSESLLLFLLQTSVFSASLSMTFPPQLRCLHTKGTPTTSCSPTVFFFFPRLFDGSL